VKLEQKLTIALPSGERSKHYALQLLRHAGLEIPDFQGSRSLSHEFGNLRLLEVKDPDVPVYVHSKCQQPHRTGCQQIRPYRPKNAW
jgi:ATP phosphoribosyltransferase